MGNHLVTGLVIALTGIGGTLLALLIIIQTVNALKWLFPSERPDKQEVSAEQDSEPPKKIPSWTLGDMYNKNSEIPKEKEGPQWWRW